MFDHVILDRSGHLSKDGLAPYQHITLMRQLSSSGALGDITLAEANNQMHESDDIVKKCDDTKPVSKTSQYLKPMN